MSNFFGCCYYYYSQMLHQKLSWSQQQVGVNSMQKGKRKFYFKMYCLDWKIKNIKHEILFWHHFCVDFHPSFWKSQEHSFCQTKKLSRVQQVGVQLLQKLQKNVKEETKKTDFSQTNRTGGVSISQNLNIPSVSVTPSKCKYSSIFGCSKKWKSMRGGGIKTKTQLYFC